MGSRKLGERAQGLNLPSQTNRGGGYKATHGCCVRRNGLGITDSEGVGTTESCSTVTPAG